MATAEEIDVFNPYQHIDPEFLNGLDRLTADPVAVPVVALLSQHPEGLSLAQTQAWLNDAAASNLYSGSKIRALSLNLRVNGVVDKKDRAWDVSSARLTLQPETADFYASMAVAIGSWQLDNEAISWRDMLAKTVMFKYEAANASDAFGLLHIMSAFEHCTGGDNVPDWELYSSAMTRLVKRGVAECTEVDEGVNSYKLAESHAEPAADLVDVLHDAAAADMNVPHFAEFTYYELASGGLTEGMKFIIRQSVQNARNR